MVRVVSTRQPHHRQQVQTGPLQTPEAPHLLKETIQEHLQEKVRRKRRTTPAALRHPEPLPLEVLGVHEVPDEARRMVRRDPVLQIRRKEKLLAVVGPDRICHHGPFGFGPNETPTH